MALYQLATGRGDSGNMLRSLTVRIVLSVALVRAVDGRLALGADPSARRRELKVHSRSAGVAAAVLGAAGFSIKAIFVKAAFRYGVDAETLLALRMLYSLPLFLLMGLAATRSAAAPISAADWRALALLGVLGYYTASYLDFLGLQYISAALERVILFTYPTMVVLFTAWRDAPAPSALDLGRAGAVLRRRRAGRHARSSLRWPRRS